MRMLNPTGLNALTFHSTRQANLVFDVVASWKIAGLLPSSVRTGQPLTQPKESQSNANHLLFLPHNIEFLVMMHGLGNQTGAF
jgi:hypothetical protein